jgi:hypothetical protein
MSGQSHIDIEIDIEIDIDIHTTTLLLNNLLKVYHYILSPEGKIKIYLVGFLRIPLHRLTTQ